MGEYEQLNRISPKLTDQVANAKTISEPRAIQAPFVEDGKMAKKQL